MLISNLELCCNFAVQSVLICHTVFKIKIIMNYFGCFHNIESRSTTIFYKYAFLCPLLARLGFVLIQRFEVTRRIITMQIKGPTRLETPEWTRNVFYLKLSFKEGDVLVVNNYILWKVCSKMDYVIFYYCASVLFSDMFDDTTSRAFLTNFHVFLFLALTLWGSLSNPALHSQALA